MNNIDINAIPNSLFQRIDLRVSETEHLSVRPYSFWKSVFTEFIKSKAVIVSTVIFLILMFFVLFGTTIHAHWGATGGLNVRPNSTFWFGTNGATKDVWTNCWRGSQISLQLAITVTAINMGVGIIIGSIWGYFRKTDLFFITLRDIYYVIPGLLFQLIMVTVLAQLQIRGFKCLVIALCIFGWLPVASSVRRYIMWFANREYNVASRTLGSRPWTIIINNILPYMLSILVTMVASYIPGVISSEVSLTYFGLGFAGNVISLGIALQTGYMANYMYNWWILFWPALIIFTITGTLYFIGIKLADATDPRTHR